MFVGAPASIGLESGIFSPNSLSGSTTIIYYSSDLLRCWCTGTTHYNAQFRTAGKARPFSTPPIGRRSCQLLEVLRGECVAGDMAAAPRAPGRSTRPDPRWRRVECRADAGVCPPAFGPPNVRAARYADVPAAIPSGE